MCVESFQNNLPTKSAQIANLNFFFKLGPLLITNSSSFTVKVHHGTNACRKWCLNAHPGYDHCKLKAPLLTHPVIVVQMLSTVLNIIIFEDCRNQWSMSRPLLGLILLNEKVSVTHRAEPSQNASVCVFLTLKFLCPSVFCWPEEQHRQQPATREAAGHALMFWELDGGNREEFTNKESGQVGLLDLKYSQDGTGKKQRLMRLKWGIPLLTCPSPCVHSAGLRRTCLCSEGKSTTAWRTRHTASTATTWWADIPHRRVLPSCRQSFPVLPPSPPPPSLHQPLPSRPGPGCLGIISFLPTRRTGSLMRFSE